MNFKNWLEANWLGDKQDDYYARYKENPRKAVHELKVWWNKAVDRSFIQSVTTIHWGEAKYVHKDIIEKQQDLSCVGYLNPPYKNSWVGNCGIIVKGYVTLAGSNDLQTNQWMGKSSRGERRKWSEYYPSFIISKEDLKDGFNEFLVSNWRPTAVVKSYSTYGLDDDNHMTAEQLAEEHNLPIVDENGKVLNPRLIKGTP